MRWDSAICMLFKKINLSLIFLPQSLASTISPTPIYSSPSCPSESLFHPLFPTPQFTHCFVHIHTWPNRDLVPLKWIWISNSTFDVSKFQAVVETGWGDFMLDYNCIYYNISIKYIQAVALPSGLFVPDFKNYQFIGDNLISRHRVWPAFQCNVTTTRQSRRARCTLVCSKCLIAYSMQFQRCTLLHIGHWWLHSFEYDSKWNYYQSSCRIWCASLVPHARCCACLLYGAACIRCCTSAAQVVRFHLLRANMRRRLETGSHLIIVPFRIFPTMYTNIQCSKCGHGQGLIGSQRTPVVQPLVHPDRTRMCFKACKLDRPGPIAWVRADPRRIWSGRASSSRRGPDCPGSMHARMIDDEIQSRGVALFDKWIPHPV